jgi:beta-lactamase regulating signal transducer with metallopeptidase domain
MEAVFLRLLNMSLSASAVIVLVILARLALRRAPKKWSYLLWAAPAFRLICPVSFRAFFSIFRLRPPARGDSAAELTYIARPAAAPIVVQSAGTAAHPSAPAPTLPAAAQSAGVSLINIAIVLWCLGAAALLVYAVVSWQRTKARLADAVLLEGNVYETDRIDAPFLLGLWRPRIYLPAGLSGERLRCVLAHERVHLRRRDHWVKLLAFLLLTVHWLSPLVWLAFFLLSRDMEMSCDEKVLAEEGSSAGEYSRSLLSFAAPRRFPLGPLAFGETDVKKRIRNALRWKKPRTWVTLAALLLVIAVTAVCAANPIMIRNPWVQEYVPGQGNIRGNVDTAKYLAVSEDLAIGADKEGRAVFKDPYKALRALAREYGSTLGKLRLQNLLPPLGYGNYRRYLAASIGTNPWAATEEERRDLAFLRGFFDIYENSFE